MMYLLSDDGSTVTCLLTNATWTYAPGEYGSKKQARAAAKAHQDRLYGRESVREVLARDWYLLSELQAACV